MNRPEGVLCEVKNMRKNERRVLVALMMGVPKDDVAKIVGQLPKTLERSITGLWNAGFVSNRRTFELRPAWRTFLDDVDEVRERALTHSQASDVLEPLDLSPS